MPETAHLFHYLAQLRHRGMAAWSGTLGIPVVEESLQKRRWKNLRLQLRIVIRCQWAGGLAWSFHGLSSCLLRMGYCLEWRCWRGRDLWFFLHFFFGGRGLIKLTLLTSFVGNHSEMLCTKFESAKLSTLRVTEFHVKNTKFDPIK